MTPRVANIREHLANHSVITQSGCIEWTGHKDRNGYGRITIGRKDMRTHRVSYEEFVGSIPDGMLVCHRCDNPSCINPEHLFLGTNLDNMQDRNQKRRHGWGERNGRAKLNTEKVTEIRKAYNEAGATLSQLAQTYGVTGVNIAMIVHGRTWKP